MKVRTVRGWMRERSVSAVCVWRSAGRSCPPWSMRGRRRSRWCGRVLRSVIVAVHSPRTQRYVRIIGASTVSVVPDAAAPREDSVGVGRSNNDLSHRQSDTRCAIRTGTSHHRISMDGVRRTCGHERAPTGSGSLSPGVGPRRSRWTTPQPPVLRPHQRPPVRFSRRARLDRRRLTSGPARSRPHRHSRAADRRTVPDGDPRTIPAPLPRIQ